MGPCEWEILPICSEWQADATPESTQGMKQARAKEMAVSLLWNLTARVFGVCEHTVRPCFRPPAAGTTYRGRDGGAGPSWWPGLVAGTWRNGPCGCSGECGCNVPASMLSLPAPIVSVLEVREDGQILAPQHYRIQNNRWLVRVDGVWPQDQNLEAADTEPGAFVVRYRKGVAVPLAGQYAAGDLACEFLRGMDGGACALPSRAISVARQGMDIQLLDPAQYLDGGLTGIPSVDQWVKSVNPGKLRTKPRVYNPDDIGRIHRVRAGDS